VSVRVKVADGPHTGISGHCGGDIMAAHTTSDKMTGAAYIFLVVSIVIGMAVNSADTGFPLIAGIAMVILTGLMYLMGK
jgi:hypothetical protein